LNHHDVSFRRDLNGCGFLATQGADNFVSGWGLRMKKLEYQVKFNTPAFLGNAAQNGQWRTPPFKALLRQWWRVAFAMEHGFPSDAGGMRREEARLFGSAADGSGNKSLVRMRLDRWSRGSLGDWRDLEPRSVYHPEVERTRHQVGPHAYLGFGPLDGRGGTKLAKPRAAIQAGECAVLSLAFPEAYAGPIAQTVAFIDRYGTLGGRSRNGWGSFSLMPLNDTPALEGQVPLRHWKEALRIDWPHAIGEDEDRSLVWQTKPFPGWNMLMRELAIVKIGLRTQFLFTTGKKAMRPEQRHWLSHPVTGHNVASWGQARLPNSLRFKVRPTTDGKLVGIVFHVPCRPPAELRPDMRAVEDTWLAVHRLLDELAKPAAARTYGSIADATRRVALKPQLDTVTLTRIAE
jgi:CRISPR-associated protein Cmr1